MWELRERKYFYQGPVMFWAVYQVLSHTSYHFTFLIILFLWRCKQRLRRVVWLLHATQLGSSRAGIPFAAPAAKPYLRITNSGIYRITWTWWGLGQTRELVPHLKRQSHPVSCWHGRTWALDGQSFQFFKRTVGLIFTGNNSIFRCWHPVFKIFKLLEVKQVIQWPVFTFRGSICRFFCTTEMVSPT